MKLFLGLTMGMFLLFLAETASAFNYHYDASVTPDHWSLQSIFSTSIPSATQWSVSNGELTINASNLSASDFGNFPNYDPVPWELGDSSEGNFVSIRAKIMSDSMDWYVYLADGTYEAYVDLVPEKVLLWNASGEDAYAVDTTEYHWYSISLINGQVSYFFDGVEIFSGAAKLAGSVPGSTVDPTTKLLAIGDIWGSGDRGIGSFVIDEVIIATSVPDPIPEPGTLILLGFGIAGLVGIGRKTLKNK